MKTFFILTSIIGVAFIIASIILTGCKSDYSPRDPFKNAPAPSPYPMLTNNPPAPLAPTGPTKQNNLSLDTNSPPPP